MRFCSHSLQGTLLQRLAAKPKILGGLWLGRAGGFLTAVAGRIRFHEQDGTIVTEIDGHGVGPPPNRAHVGEVAIASPGRVKICAPNGEVRWEYVPKGDERPMRYCGSRSGRSLLMLGTRQAHVVCRCMDAQGEEEWSATVVPLGKLATCISQDGSRVVLPESGGLQLRDGTGAKLAHLALPGGIASVAFDAAGARVVASSRTGVVRVWNRVGGWLFDLPSHAEASILSFSADGRRLASVTNTMARLFTADVDELERLAAQRCITLARRHLIATARDARREQPFAAPGAFDSASAALEQALSAHITTPSGAVARDELQAGVRKAVESLEPLDREILCLRHFEELDNAEAASSLGIRTGTASKRYMRAVVRLREVLAAAKFDAPSL